LKDLNYSTRVTGRAAADLTMVVPTYNERDCLGDLVDAVFAACTARDVRLEIVVVDDNSPDGTGQIADELAAGRAMHVIHRPGKLGLGTAVMAGFEAASADVVGVMDADFSHPPALVPEMFAAVRATGADMLVASRYVPGGATPNWPLARRVLSRVACLVARPLVPIRDSASGFFLIRREAALGVKIKAGGFKICLELLVRGWPVRLVEMPYSFADRRQGQSKMNLAEAAGYLVQLKDLYGLRWFGPRRARRIYRALAPTGVEQAESRSRGDANAHHAS
jgi:dolichol-phosphate mannosyltransferase